MLSFSLAKRFIAHNRNQSILIVLGIAIGITAQLFVGLLIQSLQQSLINQTLGTTPHISIQTDAQHLTDDGQILQKLSGLASVTTVLPVVDTNGFLTESGTTYPVLFRGVTSVADTKLYHLSDHLTKGALPTSDNQVLIGKDLADAAKISVGDTLSLQNPQGTVVTKTVAGIYDLKVAAVNKVWIFASLTAGQQFLGAGSVLTRVELQVSDPFTADTIAKDEVAPLFADNAHVTITNWKAENASLLSGLQGQSSSSYMIQLFVLLSVLVGITSVLSISVLQQSRQIGILKAMGLSDSVAGQVFAWQGAMLGFFGTVLGGAIGFAAFYSFALNVKNPDGTPLIAPVVQWPYVIGTLLIAFAVAVLAGAFPARRSKKLSPIDVIRSV